VPERISVENHSYENVFPLQVHFHVNQIHFHIKCFARELALKQKHEVTITEEALRFGELYGKDGTSLQPTPSPSAIHIYNLQLVPLVIPIGSKSSNHSPAFDN